MISTNKFNCSRKDYIGDLTSNRNFGTGHFYFIGMIEALIMYLCGLIPWIAIILLGIARNHEDKDE